MTRPNYIFGVAPKMGSVLSIGSFDGLHLGHQSILNQVISLSDRLKLPSIVASFDPHPREVLSQDYPHLLSPGSEKTALLESFSIDAFGLIPFTKMMSFVEPEEFVEHVSSLLETSFSKIIVVYKILKFISKEISIPLIKCDFDLVFRCLIMVN